MPEPVELLLITHNRLHYVERSIAQLLSDPADFRIHWWDNGSSDGAREWIEDHRDARFVSAHHAEENRFQLEPTLWFFERAVSDAIGKIDDDVLLPIGWSERFATLLRASDSLAMLACWIFMPQDGDRSLIEQRTSVVEGCPIMRQLSVQGQSFVGRRDVLLRHVDARKRGFPVNQWNIVRSGYVIGYPLPLVEAHNMDDPRSPHYHGDRPTGLTAGHRGLSTDEAYSAWIAEDAKRRLAHSFRSRYWRARFRRSPRASLRMVRRLARLMRTTA
jgi:hypothetical protein